MKKNKMITIICFFLISTFFLLGCDKNFLNSYINEETVKSVNINKIEEDYTFEYEFLDESLFDINFEYFLRANDCKKEPIYIVDDTWAYDEDKNEWKKDGVTVFDVEKNAWRLDDGSDWSGNYTIQGITPVRSVTLFKSKNFVLDFYFNNFPEDFDFENYLFYFVPYAEPLNWDVEPHGIYIKNIKYSPGFKFDIVINATPAIIDNPADYKLVQKFLFIKIKKNQKMEDAKSERCNLYFESVDEDAKS